MFAATQILISGLSGAVQVPCWSCTALGTRSSADILKEGPRLLAHNLNIVEHTTVCTSTALPIINATPFRSQV